MSIWVSDAEFKFARQQSLQAAVVHDQHHEVHAFGADLQAHTTSADGDERGRAPMRIGRALGALIWSFVGVTIGAADRHTVAVFSTDHQARFDQIRNDHDALSPGQHLFGDTFVAGVGNFFQNIGGIAQALCGVIAGRGGPGKIAEQCCQTEYPENQMSFHDPLLAQCDGGQSRTNTIVN